VTKRERQICGKIGAAFSLSLVDSERRVFTRSVPSESAGFSLVRGD
jgi:hypothetical protein